MDKKHFSGYAICKPMAKTRLMLNGFMDMGFSIEGLDSKKSPVFTVSYPDTPNLLTVLHAYFQQRHSNCKQCGDECKADACWRYFCYNHIKAFSYRYVEDPAVQTRERFFLAITEGMPKQLRDICYWLYDEAVKHGYTPQGYEYMGCYSYKKGSKEWLLLGCGSSYHEDEFLHSVNYALAAKTRFYRVFQTHPERMDALRKRFPDSFGRPWTKCYMCKAEADTCKNRVTFKKDNLDYHHCGTKSYLYFHNPTFDDVKEILELFKLENRIS